MIKNHGATRSIPLRAIKFVHTIETGTRIIGRAMLSRSGEVIVTGMSDAFRECVNGGVIGVARHGRMYPRDGIKFLRACLIQFNGSYLRALPDRRPIPRLRRQR